MDMRKHRAMMKGFDAFTARIIGRYAEARDKLEAGDYVAAQRILADLALSHARTSMSLRGLLIRQGLLKEDNK